MNTHNNLTIVYVSDSEPRLSAWRGGENWAVFPTQNLPEAMGMSVFYAPHAVVVDGDAPWLDDVMSELMSVTGASARGRDVIIRIGGTPHYGDVPEFIDLIHLPCEVTPEALAYSINAAVQGARLPKVVA